VETTYVDPLSVAGLIVTSTQSWPPSFVGSGHLNVSVSPSAARRIISMARSSVNSSL
jgi:hypothetical protein